MASSIRRFITAGILLTFSTLLVTGWARAATLTVTNTTDPAIPVAGDGSLRGEILQNVADGGGDTIEFSVTGTIKLSATLPITANVTINGPTAPPGIAIDGQGAVGVMSNSVTLNIANLTIENGSTNFGGGINNGGTLTITNCTLSGNSASLSGGGILNGGSLTVTNSTFSHNTATNNGGGIVNFGGASTVTNCTFSGNRAGSGGGINDAAGGSATLKGTILAAEPSGGNCAGLTFPPVTDANFNFSDDLSCGFTALDSANGAVGIALDPLGLQNNGGPTKTIALEASSFAIGVIPVANCTDQQMVPQPLRTDQRLFGRPDPADPTACDSGAYERGGVPPLALVPNTEHLQVARSSAPNSDRVNLALRFSEQMTGLDCTGEDALNDGLMVDLFEGTCAAMTGGPLSVDLSPFVVHKVGGESYGTFFASPSPETISARIVALEAPAHACGEWSLNLQIAGVDSTAIFGMEAANPFALVLTDGSGLVSGCFDITNAIVGNQIAPPHGVRRGSRRGRR